MKSKYLIGRMVNLRFLPVINYDINNNGLLVLGRRRPARRTAHFTQTDSFAATAPFIFTAKPGSQGNCSSPAVAPAFFSRLTHEPLGAILKSVAQPCPNLPGLNGMKMNVFNTVRFTRQTRLEEISNIGIARIKRIEQVEPDRDRTYVMRRPDIYNCRGV